MSTIIKLAYIKNVIEAALLSAEASLSVADLSKLFLEKVSMGEIHKALAALALDWQGRGLELISLASGWRFRTRPAYAIYLNRLVVLRVPRYSRAVMETLAVILYKQPVTRAEIEAIRGVSVSSTVIQSLLERNWIESIERKEVPGRPRLYKTTKTFLDDLGMASLEELPDFAMLEDLEQPR